ncbi:MAG: efflux RND transporter periplasmic adaptor subunit [Bacteroidales bacterium]|nr:efflux RND transporter periplasmic adaptor subunit [Clostridium sp.]MCM1203527.1 efflux RND transporter periplasmic adaptor subunit [Bacteroidales bacterium]
MGKARVKKREGGGLRKTAGFLLAGILAVGISGCGLFPEEAQIDDTLRVSHFTPAEHSTIKVKRGDLEYSDMAVFKYCSQEEKEYYLKFIPDNQEWNYGIKSYVLKGDMVKKGQLLAEAPCDAIKEEIKGYEEQISSLQTEVGYWQKLLELAEGETERQGYSNTIADLQGQINVLKLRIEETGRKLADYQIYADMDGQVTYVLDWRYEWYEQNTPLLRLTSHEGYFEGEIEQSLITFTEGDTVSVEVGGENLEMVVKSIDTENGESSDTDDAVNPEGGSVVIEESNGMAVEESDSVVIEESNGMAVEESDSMVIKESDSETENLAKTAVPEGKVFVRLIGEGEFESGQRAQLLLSSGERKNVLSVPVSAVTIDEEKAYVRVLAEDGYIRVKEIQVGEMIDGNYVVNGGLKEGEEIVNE